MFKFLLTLLILVSVAFGQSFTKTKSTTSFWLKNTYAGEPSRNFFYVDADSKVCSLNVKRDSTVEITFQNSTPTLWTGTRTIHQSNYNKGVVTAGTLVTFDGEWTLGVRYANVFIKNKVMDPCTFRYTHPIRGLDSVVIGDYTTTGQHKKITCVNNSTITYIEGNKSLSGVVFGDVVVGPQVNREPKGSFINFWLKNVTSTATTFWYTDASGISQSQIVNSGAVVEINYVSSSTPVWIGASGSRVKQSATLLNGDFIEFSDPPVIATNPQSQSMIVGNSVTFTATASGQQSITYQWQKNGVDIVGATTVGGTSTSYSIPSVTIEDGGVYRVIATNSLGADTSTTASLSVSTSTEISTLTNGLQFSIHPNPFSSGVKISTIRNANVDIFSLNGQRVANFQNIHQVNWTPLAEASGTYIVKVNIGSQSYNERIYFSK